MSDGLRVSEAAMGRLNGPFFAFAEVDALSLVPA